jgi:hypothetical protein
MLVHLHVTNMSRTVIFQNTEIKPSTQGRIPKPKKAPWEDSIFIAQDVSSDEVKPSEVSPPEEVPLEPIQDTAPKEICEVLFDDYIEYSMSLQESDDPILVRDTLVNPCAADRFAACLITLCSVTIDPKQARRLY